jgi:hypothetical protein
VTKVRRKLALLGGALVGAAAALSWRRRRPAGEPAAPAEPDERTEELRRKLAEAREGVAAAPDESSETPEPSRDVDEARRQVHEQGRAAAEEMRRSGGTQAD